MSVTVHHGDCLEVMRELPDESVDAVVTDPPYGLGFMGKAWDDLPPGVEWAAECLRVLKPGGHLLAFGGSRTWHRLAAAVEDAGFEIRDSIAWLYGSGFPKSLDVSKAIDRAAGVEREVVGQTTHPDGRPRNLMPRDLGVHEGGQRLNGVGLDITAPATDDARTWQGWGTALKPAFEPVVVARKPLAGTVAGNVLTHGTGALNIDACRIEGEPWTFTHTDKTGRTAGILGAPRARDGVAESHPGGRWPANVVLDESQADALDQQSGYLKSGWTGDSAGGFRSDYVNGEPKTQGQFARSQPAYEAGGGASRFFYVAKAPKRERPRTDDGLAHPTVKPLALMRWLVRLVTPPGGTVLEPFAGSGTTVEACILEGFHCIAIEREADYLPLIEARIARSEAS